MEAAAVSASVKEAKQIFLNWIRLIKSNESYYFPKAMELFYKLPANHQRGFLTFMATEVDMNKWIDKLDDDTQYPDVVRSMLFYYSGREKSGDPNKEEFKMRIAEYLKSSAFKEAEESTTAIDFKEALEGI